MKIGNLHIDGITVLAPLAGITNLPFRRIVRKIGCGLVCSEMISANGLTYGSPKTQNMLASDADEKPVSFQLFGADPAIMADAAVMAAEAGADIIDINCGCSVKKILKGGAGSALMKDPEKAREIFTNVRKAIRIPLTVKIRSGWEPSGKEAFLLARIAEDSGIDAITLHPRTATQGFTGISDWTLIAELKQRIKIPVIGNGDITRPEDAIRMLTQTGCDGVMVGRAAMGNPWIFSQIHDLMTHGRYSAVTIDQRFSAMKAFAAASVAYFGELNACRMMRSRLTWLVKGLPGASRFRESITKIRTLEEAGGLMDSYFESLRNEQD
ncbi:MAG: tRNA dihydrouridine synthase DusB [Desulfobacteraceae bacterium]|nr:MAG: tRNA dihydrouridine synthase DusB [Desulfobacteraceae bacterium]